MTSHLLLLLLLAVLGLCSGLALPTNFYIALLGSCAWYRSSCFVVDLHKLFELSELVECQLHMQHCTQRHLPVSLLCFAICTLSAQPLLPHLAVCIFEAGCQLHQHLLAWRFWGSSKYIRLVYCSFRSLIGADPLSGTEQLTGGWPACGLPAVHWRSDQFPCGPVGAQWQQPLHCIRELGVCLMYRWPSHGAGLCRSPSHRCCSYACWVPQECSLGALACRLLSAVC